MPINLLSLACWAFGAWICAPTPEPLMALSGPRDLISFELRDGREEVLWAISANPPRTLRNLYYGEVPDGFVQHRPADGRPPRMLIFGEPLRSEIRTLNRLFHHHGVASGRARFLIEGYSMQQLRSRAPGR